MRYKPYSLLKVQHRSILFACLNYINSLQATRIINTGKIVRLQQEMEGLFQQIALLEDSSYDRLEHLHWELHPETLPMLHLAAKRNDVQWLIAAIFFYRFVGKSLNHVYYGYTALDIAVRSNSVDATRLLVSLLDAKPNERLSSPAAAVAIQCDLLRHASTCLRAS